MDGDVDHYETEIIEQLNSIESLVEELKNKDPDFHFQEIAECEEKLLNVSKSLDKYSHNLQNFLDNRSDTYKFSLQRLMERHEKLTSDLTLIRNEERKTNVIENPRGEIKSGVPRNEGIIKKPRRTTSLRRIRENTRSISEELAKQTELLRLIDEEISNHIQVPLTLQRKAKLEPISSSLKEFKNEIHVDDFLMCMISLLVLVILAIFTYKIFASNALPRPQENIARQAFSFANKTASKLLFGIFQPLECDSSGPLPSI